MKNKTTFASVHDAMCYLEDKYNVDMFCSGADGRVNGFICDGERLGAAILVATIVENRDESRVVVELSKHPR